MASLTGWGRETYGSGAWNSPAPVAVTGIAGTGGVGSVSIGTGIGVSVTGVAGTGQGGSGTTIGLPIIFSVTGVSATGQTSQLNVWSGVGPNQTANYQLVVT